VQVSTSKTLLYLRVECASGWTDYPILYRDGTIAWDNPYRIPKYLKQKAESILKDKRWHTAFVIPD